MVLTSEVRGCVLYVASVQTLNEPTLSEVVTRPERARDSKEYRKKGL